MIAMLSREEFEKFKIDATWRREILWFIDGEVLMETDGGITVEFSSISFA